MSPASCGQLRFHPANPSRLLTGSTDGLVNVVDVSVSDEDEAVVQTFNHGASVHRAGWLNADELFALSHDERFAVYDTSDASDSGAAATDFGDARPLLNCQYVANVFPKLAGGASAVIGAGAQE